MKSKLMVMAGAVALGLDTAPAQAQAPVIASFGRNGELVCTNLLAGSTASVVWTSSVLGPWTNSLPGLDAVAADTNGAIRVNVPLLSVSGPMFYRVRGYAVPTNLVAIPAGSFVMGSPTTEPARGGDETQHTVTLTKGFCMGKYEVTQSEYVAVMGINPSYFKADPSFPVEGMRWQDATNY